MQKRDKYSLYVRKSRKDMELEAIGQGETLARHKAALLELAESKGLKVVKIYEEMVSGESISDRPQMQMLLDEVCAGTYAGVLVMEVERLARGNTRDQGEVAEAFAMSNTLIITPSKTYDPNDEFDEEYFEFGLFMSRREYKTIRRRMQRGLMASVQEGNYVGSLPPYGYDIIRINKKERTLVPNAQADMVKMMFQWAETERISTGVIAKRLTEMGIPTLTGRPEWNRSTVKDILQNNLYTGKIRWNRRKISKEMDDGKKIRRKRRLTPDDYIIVEGKHPALISQDTFDRVQDLFQGSIPSKFNSTIVNPFSRLIFCKHCGKAMRYASYNHKRANVQPRFVHGESTVCTVKSSTYADVMAAVVAALQAYIEDFAFKLNNDEERRQADARAEMLRSMIVELNKLEQKRDRLFDFLESGIYTKEEFIERKGVLTDKIGAMQNAITEYKDSSPPTVDYQERILKFSEVITALQDDAVSAKDKHDLLHEIIQQIEYDCIDAGRQKGGEVILDVFLKE